ncbi:hypothetical protein FACS1894181_17850 [Bacteroidia bacterium]|nr:hypothetical protein FACS1894181_17850 [Bacteroidia bacterium]
MVEFGDNLEEKDAIKPEKKEKHLLHLLFLGVDWQRKGGSIAIAACKELNQRGIFSILHIIGIKNLDKSIIEYPFVNNIGFLDKNKPEQYQILMENIHKCHCLLIPTMAECAGHVFCEASANGLPIFSHITGGTQNYVVDGTNGYLLPLGSTGIDFANKIAECYRSGELEKMSHTARQLYEEKLNWIIWSKKIKIIIESLKPVVE